jgi:hypothetical protein
MFFPEWMPSFCVPYASVILQATLFVAWIIQGTVSLAEDSTGGKAPSGTVPEQANLRAEIDWKYVTEVFLPFWCCYLAEVMGYHSQRYRKSLFDLCCIGSVLCVVSLAKLESTNSAKYVNRSMLL